MSALRKSTPSPKRATAPKRTRTAAGRNGGQPANGGNGEHRSHGSAASVEAVAQLAHQLFVDRGMAHGYDLDDWLEAERRLRTLHS
jgi:hypothetical protein